MDIEPIDFCTQPYESVCGVEAGTVGKREATRRAAVEKIRTEAMMRAAKEILKVPDPENYKTIEDLDPLKESNNELRKKTLKRWVKLTTQEFARQSDLNKFLTQKEFQNILKNFQPGLEALRSPALKKEINEKLANVKLVPASKFLSLMDPENPASAKGLDAGYLGTCNYNDGADNAFASAEVGEDQYFTPCPGLLLGAGGAREPGDPSDDAQRTQNAWVTAHELGHHFDASKFPAVYKKLEACLKKHHESELSKKAIASYMDEITADYWATQALIEDLRAKPQAVREITVVEGLEFACDDDDGSDDGVHPPGRFRIEHMVHANPQIAELLGCPAPKLSCTLEGEKRPTATTRPAEAAPNHNLEP